jgi:anaerobic magnesium-protoporphyrin IX monomethyl ester cyclase
LVEIEQLSARYPIRTLNFQDDVFTLHRAWTLAFCEAYGNRIPFPFWINTRVERIRDEEIVAALARAGCHGVRIGVESGNETLRKEVLKREVTNDDIRAAFVLLRRHGLKVYTCNMLGIPGETPAMIEETIQLNRELAPDDLQFSVFYPYPMTELHDRVMEAGLLRPDRWLITYFGKESVLDLPTITPAQLAEKYDEFVALKAQVRHRQDGPAWRRWLRRPVKRLMNQIARRSTP